MSSHNTQAYNQTNATIISIGTTGKERGCDYENISTRITLFRVTVEKMWMKEFLRANFGILGRSRGIFRIIESWEVFCVKRQG
jgi:hypothetical protein